MSLPTSILDLFESAQKAQKNSYSPYSQKKVGSAIRTLKGDIFSGCNVENSSYGATICAERVAIHSAVASYGPLQIKEILILTDTPDPWPPCGICRQVLAEFSGTDPSQIKIHLVNLQKKLSTHTLKELLPLAFDPSHLRN